jgi:DNA helicase-2/ATP-dependent DNA helicase PcrA
LNIEPNVARSRISRQKARGLSPSDIAAKPTTSVDQHEFVQVFQEYESALSNSNLLDYDDLLLKCSKLLRLHPSCVWNVEAVLVDEFQDTNLVQYDLMRLFAGQNKRITIVGDPDQSIYGFRSAEIKNLQRMKGHYTDTVVVNLEENYRSSGAILLSADQVIQQDSSRPIKSLRPTHCHGSLPTLRKLPSAAAEASWTVMEIQRSIAMTGCMLNYSDFAVLLRSSSLSRQIESALGRAGIPYRMVGGHRFFDRYEIKVLLDYLRTISQPQNNDALARIVNVPPRKIGEVTVKALLEEAETQKAPLWTVILDAVQDRKIPKTQLNKAHDQGLGTVVNLILNGRKKLAEGYGIESPLELLKYVIQKISLQKHLEEKDPENHEERWANVEELLAQAGDASALAQAEYLDSEQLEQLPQLGVVQMEVQDSGEDALNRFLANVALSTEVQQDESEARKSKVTISTIHAAKGLEWPVVFIPSAYDGSIPHSRAEDQDEERRLLYVAMTRAQSLLYISCPRWGSQAEEINLSCFLPQSIIKGRFRDKGPRFTSEIVAAVANILKRPPPGQRDIIAASLTIKSVEDDFWSTSGEAEENQNRNEIYRNADRTSDWQQLTKRRRTESSSYNEERNMSRDYPVSFMSASRVNIISQTTTMSKCQNVSKKEPAPQREPTGKKAQVTKDGKVQGTLASFFKSTQVRDVEQVAQLAQDPSVSTSALKRVIPEEFSHHRLKAGAMLPRTPRILNHYPSKYYSGTQHALISSTGDEVGQRIPATSGQHNDETQRNETTPIVRAATTFHTTTVQLAQGLNQTGRKTLGIRRTFNGWADRMAREEKRA